MKVAAFFTFLIFAAVFVIVIHRDYEAQMNLQQGLGILQTNLHDLAEEVAALKRHQERAQDPSVERPEMTELVRLSVEVAQIQQRLAASEQANAACSNELANLTGPKIPFVYSDSTKRTDYAFAGYSTPVSALESAMWAITKMDAKAYSASLTGKWLEIFAKQCQNLPEGVMPGGYANGDMFKATGFRVLEENSASPDEVHLKVFLEGSRETIKPVFQRVGTDWKWAGNSL